MGVLEDWDNYKLGQEGEDTATRNKCTIEPYQIRYFQIGTGGASLWQCPLPFR